MYQRIADRSKDLQFYTEVPYTTHTSTKQGFFEIQVNLLLQTY